MDATRVVIADDHEVVRDGIAHALKQLPNLEIVAEVGDGPALFSILAQLEPDCLILDIAMPDFEPISAIRQIRASCPDLRILVVSAYDDDVYVQGMLSAGVQGYHLKDQPLSDLTLAVQRVLAGERWVCSPLICKLLHPSRDMRLGVRLTARQHELLRCLQQGLDNQSIAHRTGLSVKTIENHLTHLYRQLQVASRLEAVNYIAEHPELLAGSPPVSIRSSAGVISPAQTRSDILIVDDNMRYRTQLKRMIGRAAPRARVCEADNTQTALGLAEEIRPELALVDVVLGEENGIECLKRIRELSASTRVILMSAYVRDFEWISPQGVVLASSQTKTVGQNVADRPYMREIAKGQEWTVSDLFVEPITSEPAFVIARGIRGPSAALQGIVFTIVDTPHLGRVFRIERPGQGAFVIMDKQGRLIYQRPEGALHWEQRNIGGDSMVRSALAGHELTGTFVSSMDGRVWMGAGTPIESVGWVARAGRPEAEVNAEILGDVSRDSVLFLLVAVGAFLVALLVSRNITVPVSRVRQYAASVGSGGNVQPVEVTGPRELEELLLTLRRMAEQIRDREELLRAEVAALDNANIRLRDAQQRLVTEREQERKALARELHDQVIQDLVSCKFQLESLASDINPRVDELTEVHESIGMLIDDIRHICTDLRPPTIDSLGLGPAIQSYLYDWSARTGIATQFKLDASLGRLPEAVELSIFRIVQEGLSNIWKHARATAVCISLKHTSSSVLISIADNGRGLGDNLDLAALATRGHYGLLGISERVGLLGGHLQVRDQPGEGVLLEAEIPLSTSNVSQ